MRARNADSSSENVTKILNPIVIMPGMFVSKQLLTNLKTYSKLKDLLAVH